MDLATARLLIEQHFARMAADYQRPVFDEWAVLSLKGGLGGLRAYAGPRIEKFRAELVEDAGPLLAQVGGRPVADGDFEFADEAEGTQFDAFMRLGATSYLVCNHTKKTMKEIRADPRWRKAQATFFELGEKFRSDPLED